MKSFVEFTYIDSETKENVDLIISKDSINYIKKEGNACEICFQNEYADDMTEAITKEEYAYLKQKLCI